MDLDDELARLGVQLQLNVTQQLWLNSMVRHMVKCAQLEAASNVYHVLSSRAGDGDALRALASKEAIKKDEQLIEMVTGGIHG